MTKKDEIESVLRSLQMDTMLLKAELKKKNQRQNQLNIEISKLEEKLCINVRLKSRLEKLLLLEKLFDEKLVEAHEQLVANLDEQKRKDITVGRLEKLKEEEKKLKESFKKMDCDHRLVRGHYYWSGSKHRSYDDKYNGYRQCLICGYGEDDYSLTLGRHYGNERAYKILKEDDNRIIDEVRREEFYTFNALWQPLSKIVQYYKDKYKID